MAIVDIFAEVEIIKQDLENLSIDELKDEITQNPDLLLIDIREIQELVDLGLVEQRQIGSSFRKGTRKLLRPSRGNELNLHKAQRVLCIDVCCLVR